MDRQKGDWDSNKDGLKRVKKEWGKREEKESHT